MVSGLVARFAVGLSAAELFVTGPAVLAVEHSSKRPAPVERAGGVLAAVNFVGILGFAALGAATAVWGLGRVRLAAGPVVALVQFLGMVCLAAAGLLAAWGLASMGRQMSSQAEVRPDTELVTGGAFRLIRHPLYLSILLLWAGGALALLSWGLALCTLILLPLFVARSRLEIFVATDILDLVENAHQNAGGATPRPEVGTRIRPSNVQMNGGNRSRPAPHSR